MIKARNWKIPGFLLLVLMSGYWVHSFFIGIDCRDDATMDVRSPWNADAPAMVEIFVAPGGDDANAGNETHPFKTIERARDEARLIAPSMNGSIVIYLREGRYHVNQTLIFNETSSGRNGHRIIYRAYPGEIPVVDGGEIISGWIPHHDGIMKCHVGMTQFRQLYLQTRIGADFNTPDPSKILMENDSRPHAGAPEPLSVMTTSHDGSTWWERRAIRARELVEEGSFSINGDGHGFEKNTKFSSMESWKTPAGTALRDAPHYYRDIEFAYHLMWNLPRVHVDFVGEFHDEKFILMQQPAFSHARTKGGTKLGDGWPGVRDPAWMENTYELLDKPGEWYHDRWTGWLYYKPLSHEDMNNSSNTRAIIPRTESLLEIHGNASNPASNMVFEGITFKHASWLRPEVYGKGHVDLQANFLVESTDQGKTYERSPAAVTVHHGRNITFERCTFTKLGSAALDLFDGTRNATVRGCTFNDISGTGINIGGIDGSLTEVDPRVVKDITIASNYFTNIAVEFKGGHAVWAGYVQDVTIEHNTISGTAYTAISVGWGWSGIQTVCHDNLVQYNYITNYMMEMKDGGAIYTLSLQNRTRVQFNHIHDGCGSGLYPDEQTWNTTWTGNVVYRSGNSLQDHTMGEERTSTSIRENNISGNFFDMLPIIEPDRQQSHIPNNMWDIGSEPSSQILAVVSGAGITPLYQDILPSNLSIRQKDLPGLYWSEMSDLGSSTDPVVYWLVISILIAGAGIGVFLIFSKAQGNRSTANVHSEEGIHD
ncbi:hypothetical protein GF325_15930 [Candidatus Bathyarchaeota archaeon]|nr:hypothetical protein [Candidatus Bathyarchaeota archaeon]